jgi:hypothetical protein
MQLFEVEGKKDKVITEVQLISIQRYNVYLQ